MFERWPKTSLYRHPFNGVFSSSHKQAHRCSFLNVITDGEWLTDLHCSWGYLRLTLRLASLAWCEIDCKAYFGIIQFHKITKRLLELRSFSFNVSLEKNWDVISTNLGWDLISVKSKIVSLLVISFLFGVLRRLRCVSGGLSTQIQWIDCSTHEIRCVQNYSN